MPDMGDWVMGTIATPEEEEKHFQESMRTASKRKKNVIVAITGTGYILGMLAVFVVAMLGVIGLRHDVQHWWQWPCLIYLSLFIGMIVGGVIINISFFVTDGVLKLLGEK